jgi:hypothetical protein
VQCSGALQDELIFPLFLRRPAAGLATIFRRLAERRSQPHFAHVPVKGTKEMKD